MVWSQDHSLEGWHIKQIWYTDGVHLSVIIFQPELESSDPFDGIARSYPINLVVSLNNLEVTV